MSAVEEEVALPSAVRKQLKEAEAIERELASEGVQEADANPEEPVDEAKEGEGEAAGASEPPTEAANERPEKAKDVDYWKRKYETLEGKYRAEVPRLHDQTRDLATQVQKLTQELMTLRMEQDERKAEENREPAPHEMVVPADERLLTKDDVDLHGEELVDLVQRGAKQVVMQMGLHNVPAALEKVSQNLDKLRAQVEELGGQAVKTSSQQLLAALAERVPDYEAISKSEEFAAWVNEVDPLSGRTRIALAQEAAADFDVDRLANIYLAFKREMGLDAQPAASAPQPEEQRAPASEPLAAKYVEPAPAAAPTMEGVGEGKIWTEEEYRRIYDPRFIREVGEKRAAELQRLADEAVREGRIRWG